MTEGVLRARLGRRAALALPALLPFAARAEGFPSHPVRVVIGYSTGGAVDSTLRVMQPRLAALLGQPVVIDARPSGNGNIATEMVVHAPPDGETLLTGTIGSLAINPALYRHLGFDPQADLAPVSLLVEVLDVLAVPVDRPWRDVAALVAAARARPGELTYGSSGIGGSGHLAAAVLQEMTDTEMEHVPYRGGGQLIVDLMSGKLDFAFATGATVLPQVQAGRLRVLAVPTAHRSALLPDAPTVAESGVPGYDVTNWYGMLAPRGTPAAIVATLNGAVRETLRTPEVTARLATLGLQPRTSTPAEFATFLHAETERWAEVVRRTGIRIE